MYDIDKIRTDILTLRGEKESGGLLDTILVQFDTTHDEIQAALNPSAPEIVAKVGWMEIGMLKLAEVVEDLTELSLTC